MRRQISSAISKNSPFVSLHSKDATYNTNSDVDLDLDLRPLAVEIINRPEYSDSSASSTPSLSQIFTVPSLSIPHLHSRLTNLCLYARPRIHLQSINNQPHTDQLSINTQPSSMLKEGGKREGKHHAQKKHVQRTWISKMKTCHETVQKGKLIHRRKSVQAPASQF